MKQQLKQIAMLAIIALTAINAEARIDKEDRVLVVVSELQRHGPENLRSLYGIIENLTSTTTSAVLGDDYKRIHYLKRSQATVANFRSLLQALSKDSSIKAIDVIFSLHGSDNRVAFYEGSVSMSSLTSQILATSANMTSAQVATMRKKLRMIYNLSCFGRSHNDDFIQMGFDVSVGSRGINANSEGEFPSALSTWSFNWKFIDTFNISNTDVALTAADTPVRMLGIAADSKKFFLGRTDLTISTDPR